MPSARLRRALAAVLVGTASTVFIAIAGTACAAADDEPGAGGEDDSERRAQMISEIEADVRATRTRTGRERLAPLVMTAMATVPRHEFVPDELRRRAYLNRPLPIGQGQTISQPYIVALMSDLLEVEPGDKVLEVGTGSGYQAAVLAELGARVYSIEILAALAEESRLRLERLGYEVAVRHGDGYAGWPEEAPFAAIIVTAAAAEIPPPLVAQLARGGRMVIPVKQGVMHEELTLLVKDADGAVTTRDILPVRFVPLTGDR